MLEWTGKVIPEMEQSDKEKELISAVFKRFREYQSQRDTELINFDGLRLIEYIEESYRRYTTNVDIRPDIEDWQSITHDQMTRNKVNAVLSKVVSILPMAEIRPRGDEDIRKASLLNELYQFSEDSDDYEDFMSRFLLEAIVKGTAIGEEIQISKTRKVRRLIEGKDGKTTIKEESIEYNTLTSEITPLEDFYPESLNIGKISDMNKAFKRKRLPYSKFMADFSGKYPRAIYVKPKITFEVSMEERPYYLDFISSDVEEGNVEMLTWYDCCADEYVIIANGIWLNPLTISDEEEVISPIPYNHKKLPFFDIRFELFSHDFFYGKSLPDKLKVFQDVLNVFNNMLIDQSILTIFQPILTNGFDSLEDDFLRPGRRTPIDTQGLPINQAVMTLDMKTPGNWHQFILDYTRKIMEEASVDKVSQGQAGVGDRVTAQEIRVASEGVTALLGLFARWIKYGIKRKCELRTKNILQFWTAQNSAKLEGILGRGGTGIFAKAFGTVTINNTTLSDGKRGTKILALFEDINNAPTGKELEVQAKINKKLNNDREIEYIAIDFNYLQNLEFDVITVLNKKYESTKDMDKAIAMEKTRIYLSFFPEMVDKAELFAQLAETLGDDPTKIMKEDVMKQMMGEAKPQEENPMADKGVSQNPQGDIMQNSMQSAMGKQIGVQNIKQLMGNITG